MTSIEVSERCSCKPCRRQVQLVAERYAKEQAQPLAMALKALVDWTAGKPLENCTYDEMLGACYNALTQWNLDNG